MSKKAGKCGKCGSSINYFSKFLTELEYELYKDTPDISAVLAIINPLEANLSAFKKCGLKVESLESQLTHIKDEAISIKQIKPQSIKVKDALSHMRNSQSELRSKFDRVIEEYE